MATEIKVPVLGESVSEATVARWMKSVGDAVGLDEPLVELETDKVTLEVNAPVAGTLQEIVMNVDATVGVDALLGVIAEGAAPAQKPEAAEKRHMPRPKLLRYRLRRKRRNLLPPPPRLLLPQRTR